jgi:hypothetical protein
MPFKRKATPKIGEHTIRTFLNLYPEFIARLVRGPMHDVVDGRQAIGAGGC